MKDVDQVPVQIRNGKARYEVFPELEKLHSEVSGEGLRGLCSHQQDRGNARTARERRRGRPGRRVARSGPAAALSLVSCATRRTLQPVAAPMPGSEAGTLGIEDDPTMVYEFVFGSQRHRRYSDKADKLLRESIAEIDMDKIWKEYGPKRRPKDGI